ncbi:MAG: fluoride efflux transporter CrcB [Chloroflexota bacterium]|nr:fluoride efflux transporter CrcB [Chloroflexota bacterium]MED5428021.1 fluoride efflux transporter CrcB [Chloroflexota bacterium]
MNLILIGVGGALGAVSRYGVDKLLTGLIGQTVLGTFAVNISGSLILGLIAGMTSSRTNLPEAVTMFLAIGFCGSFTTFSTVTVASFRLFEDGDYITASTNIFGSVIVGLAAAGIGLWLGRHYF